MQTCYETEIAGFRIVLDQQSNGKFWVTYGKQETGCDTYEIAAKKLGLSILHALACEGRLIEKDN